MVGRGGNDKGEGNLTCRLKCDQIESPVSSDLEGVDLEASTACQQEGFGASTEIKKYLREQKPPM